jgi:hypothetical protein
MTRNGFAASVALCQSTRTPQPPLCRPGVSPVPAPDSSLLGDGGGGIYSWERIVSAAVWIAREDRIEDGRMLPGEATIHVDHQDALDAVGARRLAAELVAAAELAAYSSRL